MRQIILISRIHPYDIEEFSKYRDDPSDKAVRPDTEGGIRLLIIKGSEYQDSDPIEEGLYDAVQRHGAEKLDKDAETIIAYHYEYQIDSELRSRFEQGGWTCVTDIKKYGSGGDESKNPLYLILNELGAEIKAGRPVSSQAGRLWEYLAHDPELEAKLRLLRLVVTGGTRKQAGQPKFTLEEIIQTYQAEFDQFAEHDVDVFSVLNDAGAFNDYRDAIEKLRDSLDINYHYKDRR